MPLADPAPPPDEPGIRTPVIAGSLCDRLDAVFGAVRTDRCLLPSVVAELPEATAVRRVAAVLFICARSLFESVDRYSDVILGFSAAY